MGIKGDASCKSPRRISQIESAQYMGAVTVSDVFYLYSASFQGGFEVEDNLAVLLYN